MTDVPEVSFETEMSDPDVFNDCTCDMWPGNEPHRHLGALVEE